MTAIPPSPSDTDFLRALLLELKKDSFTEILDYQSGRAGLNYTGYRIYGRIKMACQGFEALRQLKNYPFTPQQWDVYKEFRKASFHAIETDADANPQAALTKLEELIENFVKAIGPV